MAFEDSSGLPGAYDRGPARPTTSRIIFREGQAYYAQAAEHNELQTIMGRRIQRIGDRVMKNGDRIEGAEAFVNTDAGTVHCYAGRIYVDGLILDVAEATLQAVPMLGNAFVGVRVLVETITEEDDVTLLGLHPGTAAEGEPGAARQIYSLAWGFGGDGGQGDLYSVYELIDGTIITQAPPPALTGIMEQIARYDMDANGHYIVDGCEVKALGRTGAHQLFSIGHGTANILGFKRIRETAFTLRIIEAPDVEEIVAEGHIFTGPTGGDTIITVNRPAIASIAQVQLVKRFTQQIVRGAVPGGTDALAFSSAFQIEQVKQGGTTFQIGTYGLGGGSITWAPVGAEPAGASTYEVTYLYYAAAAPAELTDRQFKISGGVQGQPVAVTYFSKLPRIDIICLDVSGRPIYVKGVSARRGSLAPPTPTQLLKLAEVHNTWLGLPVISNNGTRNFTYDDQRRFFGRLIDILDQFDRQSVETDILTREPVSKAGIFTDTFVDDFYRDQGEPQTAAINQGVLQLAIDPVMLQMISNDVVLLPFEEVVIVSQAQRTSSMRINPYDNFTPMPAGMLLEPSVDFWTDELVEWTSPVTREFTAAPDQPPGQSVLNEVTEIRREAARFLRTITVVITLSGFGVNENLATLTFDGRNVKPAGVQTGNAQGEITVSIAIPDGVPSGRRLVEATGAAGSFASAIFVGEGTIDVNTMRRVTLVTHAAPVPIQITNINITQVTNVTVQQLVNPVTNMSWGSSDDEPSTVGGTDPLAQSWRVPAPALIVGVNLWVTAVGLATNSVRVQMATMLNGFPTTEILGEAFVSMVGVSPGDKLEVRFPVPIFASPTREYCFVILTSDGDHALAISRLGDVDTGTQRRVSSQPYTIGELFSSSNRISWSTHPDADLAFEIVVAKFTATSSVVNLWTGPLNQISDILVRGVADVPTQDAGVNYELVRASGAVIRLSSGQSHEFDSYVTETVTLRAVLQGTEQISPVLFPGTLLAGGRIRQQGTYVTRVFPMGSAVSVAALFKALLPAGSNIAVHVDAANSAWTALALGPTGLLGDGWVEPKYQLGSFTAAQGRVRLTLNGGPGARPSLAQLRTYTI